RRLPSVITLSVITSRAGFVIISVITGALGFGTHRCRSPTKSMSKPHSEHSLIKNLKNICKGGPGPGPTFLLPVPPGRLARGIAAPTNEQSGACSPVAFNDIKHLARSMPADGLEAQDVVPPRCGCWVAHEPAIPT